MENVEWLMLMVFMLDLSKRFTLIEKVLRIRYVYTYKNDQLKDVSYKLEGYVLLATMAVKLARHLLGLYLERGDQRVKGAVRGKEGQGGAAGQVEAAGQGGEKVLCRVCYD